VLGVGLTSYPVKKKIVEKPLRNSVGFFGGGQGLSWAVEPRKEEEEVLLAHESKQVTFFELLKVACTKSIALLQHPVV
jgi:hypothetical protein